ncbi:MAG TPA: hypothetical protein VI279_11155 [Rhodocyclaceae bacterium]
MKKVIPWVGGGIGGLGMSLLVNGSVVAGLVLVVLGVLMIVVPTKS